MYVVCSRLCVYKCTKLHFIVVIHLIVGIDKKYFACLLVLVRNKKAGQLATSSDSNINSVVVILKYIEER